VRGLNAIATTESPSGPDRSVRVRRPTATPRTSGRAKAAADLAQLVGELGDELLRYHADRRLRLDRTSLPPSTGLLLVATIPSQSRDSSPEPSLRAVTTVTVKR
jgi:hypothetical protein